MVRRRSCAVSNHERRTGFHPSRRARGAAPQDEERVFPGTQMSQSPPAPPSLEVLRQEIDAIDEQVHRLLMARGDIIDRLIQVKQTQEVGSAFRPAREAAMMRRLVERHRGILPIDTIESIWRVIISTFTYVQAPFSVHADVSVGKSAMRDSARFHFGFAVPYVSHFSAQAAVEAVAKSKGDLALVSATSSRTPWWIALEAAGAPKIIARLPFVERADHPAALPVFVVSRVADSAMVTEVETWSVRVSGWNAEIARALSPLAEIVAVPDTAFDGAALLVSVARPNSLEKIKSALIEAGASVRSSALVGSHATRYTVPPNGAGQILNAAPDFPELKMSRPVPNPGILDIAPYTPGKSPVPEPGRKVFKLSANETPFGPSPKAIEVYKAAADHLEDYPEGTSRVLREAIGRAFGLDPDRIICGAGSDEILNLLAHTYLSQGDEAISTAHGFLVYPIATMANGAINVVAPETEFHRRRRRDPEARCRRAPNSSGSPTRTTRPGPICRSTRSSGCAPACRRTCCWCSMPPIPTTCRATITSSASNWWRPPTTPW